MSEISNVALLSVMIFMGMMMGVLLRLNFRACEARMRAYAKEQLDEPLEPDAEYPRVVYHAVYAFSVPDNYVGLILISAVPVEPRDLIGSVIGVDDELYWVHSAGGSCVTQRARAKYLWTGPMFDILVTELKGAHKGLLL